MPDGSGHLAKRASGWNLLHDPMYRAVLALGISQMVAWGTTFYLLGAIGQEIVRDLGWSRSLVFAGMTVGLIVAGFVSPRIGRLSDTYGAYVILACGTILAAMGLTAIAFSVDPVSYLAAWALLGLAMRMTLYDAAFAALVEAAPGRGRLAISYLTLFGGFASTVFWPLGYWLANSLGWRDTLFVFACIQLLVCMPLLMWGLSPRRGPAQFVPVDETPSKSAGLDGPILQGRDRSVAMVLFAAMISANSFILGASSAHMISVLQAAGLAAGAAVFLASLKGVAQVAGRAWEIFLAPPLSALSLARLAVVLVPLSFVALLAGGASFEFALLFTILFGVSNGIVTIVRGALPLALFGAEGYGALLGMLATPQLLMNAAAPLVYAALVDAWGPMAGLASLVVASLISLAGMEALVWQARAQKAQGQKS